MEQNPDSDLLNKWQGLIHILAQYKKLGIALSGGVDSALILTAAAEAVDAKNTVAFTIQSPVEFKEEVQTARQIATQLSVQHIVIPWNDLDTPGFIENPPERCYLCKRQRLSLILSKAQTLGLETLCDGSNADDTADFRPGRRALQELEIISPLAMAGLTKIEIRKLAHWKNLPVWDKPSMPCLATRIPYGTPIQFSDIERLAKGETILRELGFSPVRLRLHEQVTRVEISPSQFEQFLHQREKIVQLLQVLAFPYLSLDLAGFRSGSMNEGLNL